MIIPPKLTPGDRVGITATGRKVAREQIAPATDLLSRWGLVPVVAPALYSSQHSYFAGSDQERLSDMQHFIDDESIKAIFCARGGYGTSRIVDRLDFSALIERPTWIIGFSDVTALHLSLAQHGLASAHATMPLFFGKEDAAGDVDSLHRLLFEGSFDISWRPDTLLRTGSASGRLIGGNLSLLADALGTPASPDTTGALLVVEEIDEYLYKVDRMFTQLRRSGKLSSLAGLLVGYMSDLKNSDLPFGESLEEIVMNATSGYDYPVAFHFPSGHEHPNLAWLHGGYASLRIDASEIRLKGTALNQP